MSYLVMPAGVPDFSKAVISLWFRVPKASLEAVNTPRPPFYFIMEDCMPLVTFGRPVEGKATEAVYKDINVLMGSFGDLVVIQPYTEVTGYRSVMADQPLSPSFIGVTPYLNSSHPSDNSVFYLIINLQTEVLASMTGYNWHYTKREVYPLLPGGTVPPDVREAIVNHDGSGWTFGTPGTYWKWYGFADFSDHFNDQPEFFTIRSPVQLKPDHWHHLLLSFDLSGGCSTHGPPQTGDWRRSDRYTKTASGTDTFCRLWYAIDDVNYNGDNDEHKTDPNYKTKDNNLGPYFVDGASDPNAILSENAWKVADSLTGYTNNKYTPQAHCTFADAPIPSNLGNVAIPTDARYAADFIKKVELAEFQLFTGVTLDTGVMANRRAFIDVDGKPAKPAVAEAHLKQRPAVLLNGSSKWQQGRNTGSLGFTPAGEVVPAGQFQRQGVINRYKPDPTLHGPQIPSATAGPVQLTRTAAHAGL